MARANRPVSGRQAWWLLATALAASAPLVQQVPLWLALAAASAFAWRAALTWRQWHLPPRWLLVLLVIAGTVGVFLQYRSIMGRTPGIALLVVFLALKLLELRAARDAVATALLCYFLVLGQFLFTQTIATALLAGLAVLMALVAWSCILVVFNSRALIPGRRAVAAVALSIPVLVYGVGDRLLAAGVYALTMQPSFVAELPAGPSEGETHTMSAGLSITLPAE